MRFWMDLKVDDLEWPLFTMQSSYASTVLVITILSVCLSVCPPVCHTRALWWNEIIYSRYFDIAWKGNHSSFWHQQRLAGDVPFHLIFVLKVTHLPSKKRQLRQISAYNVWTIRANKKCSIIVNKKSTMHFPTSYRWSASITPNFPIGWLKKRIYRFSECYKVSLCEKFQWPICSRTIPLSNSAQMLAVYVSLQPNI